MENKTTEPLHRLEQIVHVNGSRWAAKEIEHLRAEVRRLVARCLDLECVSRSAISMEDNKTTERHSQEEWKRRTEEGQRMMDEARKTTSMSAKGIIIEALGFHGVFDAEDVADHIIWSLGEEGFHVVKEVRHD